MADRNVDLSIRATDQTRAAFEAADRRIKQISRSTTVMSSRTRAANQQFGAMRGSLGQLGYQIQDVAVQLQSGQNAMLVFGQQGSQIASIFGPGGAVIGAVLAVSAALGTALLPRLFDSTDAAKDLEQALEDLDGIVATSDDNVLLLADAMGELARQSKAAAEVELRFGAIRAADALNASLAQMGETLENSFGGFLQAAVSTSLAQIERVRREGLTFDDVMATGPGRAARLAQREFGVLRGEIRDVSEELGITEQAAFDLLAAFSANQVDATQQSLDALSGTILDLQPATGDASEALVRFQAQTARQAREAATAAERVQFLNDSLREFSETGQIGETESSAKANQEAVKALQARMEAETRIREQAEQRFAQLQSSLQSPAERLRAQYEERLAVIQEYEATEFANMQAANEAKLALEQQYTEQHTRLQAAQAQASMSAAQSIVGITSYQMNQLAGLFKEGSAAGKAFFVAQQALAAANAVVQGYQAGMAIRVAYAQLAAMTANPALAAAGEVHAKIAEGMGIATAGIIGAQTVASFAGGGYTGPGVRAGGLDGQGGYMAMVHPQESIIDHTQDWGLAVGSTTVNINVYAHDATGFDRLITNNRGKLVRVVQQALNERGRVLSGRGPRA